MLTTKKERQAIRRLVRAGTSRPSRPRRGDETAGQALVEFALMVPLVFLLLVNAFNFGGYMYCWTALADAVRAAGDYVTTDESTAGTPRGPTTSAIQTLVQNSMAGVPNYSSSNLQVNLCENDNGVSSPEPFGACPNGVTPPPADPEPIANGSTIHYANVVVDVTYTYTPLIGGASFLGFGLPSFFQMHRRVVVRWP